MNKRIITMFMTVLMATSMLSTSAFASDNTISDLTSKIEICVTNKNTAHEMANCARALNMGEDSIIIKLASARWFEENDKQKEYQKQLNELKANEIVSADKKARYPYAAQVWETLKGAGYSDNVCAGILGNMMRECGGQTLALQPYVSSGNYYGICQWYLPYTNGKLYRGADINTQLNYLLSSIEYNFRVFGYSYANFLNSATPEDAAYLFEVAYERGAKAAIPRGMQNARVAYNYFTS